MKEFGEYFDYHQEVARSAFADMLHDTERNQKYSEGLKEAIATVKSRGLKANVLDIGTGTGLLAMLAAKHGADSVTTIEAFSPVSHIARRIIEENGFKDKIRIINKHSTQVTLGAGKDMEQRANILVAEVLDTELIGEGAVKTYNSAHEKLTEPGCLCVPDSAVIYVQIADCPRVVAWNTFISTEKVKCPDNVKNCSGSHGIHDLQLSQLPMDDFTILSDPMKVCEIDFSGKSPIPKNETFLRKFVATADGEANAAFFWWDIKMNPSGSILLSCAPHWAHPDTEKLSGGSSSEEIRRNSIPWRDHWMQACFFLKARSKLKRGEIAEITGSHDEYSWWFDLGCHEPHERPSCTSECLFHISNSRNRTLEINSLPKLENLHENKNYLFLGEHNMQALEAAASSSAGIYLFENETSQSLENFINFNNLSSKIHRTTNPEDLKHKKFEKIIAEPFYQQAVLPYDNIIEFWRQLQLLNLQPLKISPSHASIFAIPVQFLNLHKIRWPLESSCEGFDHKIFDKTTEIASHIADANVEPFSLWEYPCIAMGEAVKIFSMSFYDANIEETRSAIRIVDSGESCNGIAFWVEWKIDENRLLSCGPETQPASGSLIKWKPEYRQGVHLISSKDMKGKRITNVIVRSFYEEDELKMEFSYQ